MRVLVFQDRLASLGNTGLAQRASAGGRLDPPRIFNRPGQGPYAR